MVKKQDSKPVSSYKKTIILSIFAGFFLLLTNTAVWINNQIFDSQAFTNTVTTSLTSESSRIAMSQEITDRIFVDRPILKRAAGDFSTKIISGLLATDQFSNLLTPAVGRIQAYATSSNQEDVAIELGGIKDVITRITNVAEDAGREPIVRTENIPDQITLVESNNVPDLYKIGTIFLWLAPISFLIALVMLAYPYIKQLNDKRKTIALQGSIITAFGIIGLLAGPMFKPPVLASVKGPNGRVVVGNLYDAFINTFNSQTMILVLIGILMILISTIWLGYPYAKNAISTRKK